MYDASHGGWCDVGGDIRRALWRACAWWTPQVSLPVRSPPRCLPTSERTLSRSSIRAGDGQRSMGWQQDGTSLMWTVLNRNKRCVTLDLHDPEGQELLRQLADTADILIENFRPGMMDSWGIGYKETLQAKSTPSDARCHRFRPNGALEPPAGFGTIAEAVSGFAHINGHPDGPPTLPPFALGDAIAGGLRRCRRHVRAPPSPDGVRQGTGDRPQHLRAPLLDPRPADVGLRSAGRGSGSNG